MSEAKNLFQSTGCQSAQYLAVLIPGNLQADPASKTVVISLVHSVGGHIAVS